MEQEFEFELEEGLNTTSKIKDKPSRELNQKERKWP